jgi:acetolactate synthase-1/2/3 large subunit
LWTINPALIIPGRIKLKIRGGALVARALKEKGVDQVFTLSGGFCNPALEGFMECGIWVLIRPDRSY